MDLKGAEIRNVKSLCSEIGSKTSIPMRVNIPYYQRPYKWGEENISNLIRDFNKNNGNEYFVGSAVMVATEGKRHDVIDGQQRVTTMFLLSYLKFLLERAYIEELINKKRMPKLDMALTRLEELSQILFGKKIYDQISKVHEDIIDIISQDDLADNAYDDLLVMFQNECYLPDKNLSDEILYMNNYSSLQSKLLKKAELSLNYSRDSYNNKLKDALASFAVILSDSKNPDVRSIDNDDELVMQYINALKYEFNYIYRSVDVSGKKPLDVTIELISIIDSMLENIKFCVIITGNEKDAYTLFEVLNDRALEIEDLDLIKNLFYKWYCNHATDETEDDIDKCIEEVDKIWVEKVFPTETGKERTKLISFLAAEFFTADDSLKFNENERYREIIESNYLEGINDYNSINIKNDIYVYQMVSTLIKEFGLVFSGKNERVLAAENDASKSITYRAFHLMNALKLSGVMPALSNIILKKYIDNNTLSSGLIDIDHFSDYVENIASDYNHVNTFFEDIHRIAFDLWKFAMLTSSYELPRQEAKIIIAKNNVNKYDTSYSINANEFKKMQDQFEKWADSWKYGKSETDLKAKVLFIKLFETEKTDGKLNILPSIRKFTTTELQLDHMEANNINESASEKYFKPENTGEIRGNYTNGLGNFMILDDKNNNNKNNLPLESALDFYDKMCPHHWLIQEVRDMLKDDKYAKDVVVSTSTCRVPVEAFFVQRKHYLMSYFKTILSRNIKDTSMDILNITSI